MLHAPVIADGVLRPTRAAVDLDAIARNYAAIAAHTGTPVMAILKANAYGHGLVEVARRLEAEHAAYFGVAYLEEGLKLRQAGVRTPILVLGGIVGEQIPLFLANDLTLCASSVDKLAAIDAAATSAGVRARVHLKIDTGMERIGVHWYSASNLLEASVKLRSADVEGIYSHFANADAADLAHARLQLARFHEVLAWYDGRGIKPPMRHMANSGAILQLPEARFDLVRPGVLLYGAYPDPECAKTIPVEPALRWTSRVVFFKVVKAGNPVSYGSTWAPDRDTRVITVPVGYGDGYHRAMSGRAEVIVRGRRHPVVGRICMDQILVDIGQDTAWNGDEVVLIGTDGDATIRVEDLAEWAGTVPHEVLTSINTRVTRTY
jgi:alanine racemase